MINKERGREQNRNKIYVVRGQKVMVDFELEHTRD